MRRERIRNLALGAIFALAVTACDDGLPPGPDPFPPREIAIILNSTELSITVFPSDSVADSRAIGLAQAGSPVSIAARGQTAVVPMGFLRAAAIVNLEDNSVSTVTLPENSGATGVAFLNDSIVYVANPNLNTVSRINVFAGTHEREIEVGVFPQAVAVNDSLVFVLNGELDANFQPARAGTISVIDTNADSVVATITLTGMNPSAAEFWFDRLYVVNSGTFLQGDGSLSIVNPNTLQETAHHAGFAEFPGDIAITSGALAYVSSFDYGIAVWDIAAETFINSPADPLVVAGQTISSGVGLDETGRLYTLIPGDCIAPSVAYRVAADTTEAITTGACPIDLAFTNFGAR